MKFRPSAAPMLSQCVHWEGDQTAGTEQKDAGSARHHAAQALYAGNAGPVSELPEDEAEGVRAFVAYVQQTETAAPGPTLWETQVTFTDPVTFETYPGTADASRGHLLWDLKSRRRNYRAQMATYAHAIMEADPSIRQVEAHVFYAMEQPDRAGRYPVDVETFTRENAAEIVSGILEHIGDATVSPRANVYCSWCRHAATCKAITAPVAVAAAEIDPRHIEHWPPEHMESAEEIAVALSVWRTILRPWGEAVDRLAIRTAEAGTPLPGWELKSKAGRKYVADVAAAFVKLGLPAADFISACDLRLNSSKTNKAKIGIIDKARAAWSAPSLDAAKREVFKLLDGVIRQSEPSKYLAAKGGDTQENDDN